MFQQRISDREAVQKECREITANMESELTRIENAITFDKNRDLINRNVFGGTMDLLFEDYQDIVRKMQQACAYLE